MKIGGDTIQIEMKYKLYFSLFAGIIYCGAICVFYLLLGESIQLFPLLFRTAVFLILFYLVFFKLVHRKQKVTCPPEHTALFYGVAYQQIKTLSTIGVLRATEQQLIFEPKIKHLVENTWTMDWQTIDQVRVYRFLGWFEYGIIIQTKGKMKFKFVVDKPHVWLQAIQTKMES